MGTSLAVQPFAGLAGRVSNECPRLLINREKVGEVIQVSIINAYLRLPLNIISDHSSSGIARVWGWL